jgi:PDZ domain
MTSSNASMTVRSRTLIAAALIVGLYVAVGLKSAAVANGRPMLGVGVGDPSPPWHGALIGRVATDSAAQQAGLLPRDLIVAVDSQPIRSASDLTAYMASRRAGERIILTVMRWNGASLERLRLTATLGASPPLRNQGAGVRLSGGAADRPGPAAPARSPAHGSSHLSWSTFNDPYESAFSIDVPRGWKVAGGIVRKKPNPIWPNAVVRVLSPERRTMIAIGDPDSAPYSEPIPASEYVRRFTERAMSEACLGLGIVEVHELPDVERFASSHSMGPYNQWSAAQASFTCKGTRQAGMDGEAIAVLQFMTTLRSGQARVLAGFVTMRGQEKEADALLNHMISSFHLHARWQAQEEQLAGQLANGAMARWQGEQRQFQQIDDVITNTAHFVGPQGQRYDLDSRPLYQWLMPGGRTEGTNTPTPPSPGATRLTPLPQ